MSQPSLKQLAVHEYQRPEIVRGYTNQTLEVDLSNHGVDINPVTPQMKDLFIGGRGFGLYMLWQGVKSTTKWDDPENSICIASGPLGGTPSYPGSGKSIVCSLSPLTGAVIDSNVGGYFGPYLKFSGFDALKIKGKSEQDLVLVVDGIEGHIAFYEASNLPWDSYELSKQMTEHLSQGKARNISVVSTGPGAANTKFGLLNFSWFDTGRKRVRYKQAGRGGIGTVFADKGIKAIVARWGAVSMNTNAPADKPALKMAAKRHAKEIRIQDPLQNRMSTVGTAHLVTIMNDFDLLPVNNYQYGSHPEAVNLGEDIFGPIFDKGFDGCWMGCALACAHGVKDFSPLTGPYAGQMVFVDGPEYETIAGCGSNLGIFDAHFVLEMNFYCDAYGIDTISVGTGMAFVMECFTRGLITKEQIGMDLSFGNRASALEVVHQMGRGEGFGKIAGQGIRYMKDYFAREFGADRALLEDIGMESKGLEFSEYMSKESLAQQGGYGLTLKGPQHDEAWLIFLDMVHNHMPTFEQKAEALHWFPMFRTWFGLCGLCKLPWNDVVPGDNKETPEPAKVMKHVKWYAEYFSSVTGRQVGPDDLIAMSEVVYNFQRVFNLKLGYGTREHDRLPYRAMGPVTLEEYESRAERYDGQLNEKYGIDISGMDTQARLDKLRELREAQYDKLKDAVYERRGWTPEGIPSLATVKRLGIDFPDVLEVLKEHGVS